MSVNPLQQREAAEAEPSLDRAVIAHELNNVLAAVEFFTALVERRGGAASEDLVKGLRSAIARGKRLTTRLTRS